jgi:hypothetical protein
MEVSMNGFEVGCKGLGNIEEVGEGYSLNFWDGVSIWFDVDEMMEFVEWVTDQGNRKEMKRKLTILTKEER